MSIIDLLPAEMKERLVAGVCIECGHPFTSSNVHSDAGWRETKLSHLCEDCFDALMDDED